MQHVPLHHRRSGGNRQTVRSGHAATTFSLSTARCPRKPSDAGDRHTGVRRASIGDAGANRRFQRFPTRCVGRVSRLETHASAQSERAGSLCGSQRIVGSVHGCGHTQRRDVLGDTKMKFTRGARGMLGLTLFSALLFGQGSLDPAKLLQPPTDSWPTYNGDYSGRRYSTLSKINASNIHSLTLAWVYRASAGAPGGGFGGFGGVTIKGTPLVVNGILYVTAPDHVWAVDARSGRE